MQEIYESLYEIGLEKTQLEFSQKAAVAVLGISPTEFDLLKVVHFENMEFVEAIYMGVFHRIIEDEAKLSWKQYENLQKKDFQKKVIKAIMNSLEYRNGHTVIINNIYGNGHISVSGVKKVKNFFLGK